VIWPDAVRAIGCRQYLTKAESGTTGDENTGCTRDASQDHVTQQHLLT